MKYENQLIVSLWFNHKELFAYDLEGNVSSILLDNARKSNIISMKTIRNKIFFGYNDGQLGIYGLSYGEKGKINLAL